MASIGSYTFISIRGVPDEAGQHVEEITRPGVDGSAFRITGKRGEPTALTCIRDYESFADAQKQLRNYKRLIGTTVTLTDDFALSHTNVEIIAVRMAPLRSAVTAVGGLSSAKACVMMTQWMVQATDVLNDTVEA